MILWALTQRNALLDQRQDYNNIGRYMIDIPESLDEHEQLFIFRFNKWRRL
jgi:hypothetical protein